LPTVLSRDVYLVARKAPIGDENCLHPNHFAKRLLHPAAGSVNGRVLLIRSSSDLSVANSDCMFDSYSAENFQADLKSAKPDLSNVSFRFPNDATPDCVQSSVTFLPLKVLGSIIGSTYVRLSCRIHVGVQHWSVEVQPLKRSALVSLHSPKSFRDMRKQLARNLTWNDFGHDSDWQNPSSSSPISAKFGWEVGLLATTLGDDICMLARKPPNGDERCLPFNHFAFKVLHEKHLAGRRITYIMGNVLFVKADQRTVDMVTSAPICSLQPLGIEEFSAAYNALCEKDPGLLNRLTLTMLENPVLESVSPETIKADSGRQNDSETVGAFVTATTSSPGNHGLDDWEVIFQAEVDDSA